MNYSALTGGEANCRGCHWTGQAADLLTVPGSEGATDERMVVQMLNEMRQLLSGELGLPYLKFLLKWGFMAGSLEDPVATVDRKVLARYFAAIARGIMTSLFEERARREAERVAGKVKEN